MAGPWRSRGYLPHYDAGTIAQFVTFRLADSLPSHVLSAWKREIDDDDTEAGELLRTRVQHYLDAGHGACWLRDERIAGMTQEALLHFDGQRYHLHAWVVMPNHVHALVQPQGHERLEGIVRNWKGYTARRANQMLSREGRFWQPDYFDRYIRDQAHHDRVVAYIEDNPRVAGLCRELEEWPWSSARWRLGDVEGETQSGSP